MRSRVLGVLCAVLCGGAIGLSQSSALRIVVIGGEDGVNIVGKGTAVAPVVEVRDRNDLPVSGASVVFLIGGKNAKFAGNAARLAVTSDQSGHATATGLQAVGKGAVRIQVQATYQGETATATVTQTNFANVAEAAQAGKSVTSPQSGANSASQNASQAAAQGSHHIGLIAVGAGAVAGGVVAKNALGALEDNTVIACQPESEVAGNAYNAFTAATSAYTDCVRRGPASACAAELSAVSTAAQRYVAANAVYCSCGGLPPGFTSVDANAYLQNLVAGIGNASGLNCRPI